MIHLLRFVVGVLILSVGGLVVLVGVVTVRVLEPVMDREWAALGLGLGLVAYHLGAEALKRAADRPAVTR